MGMKSRQHATGKVVAAAAADARDGQTGRERLPFGTPLRLAQLAINGMLKGTATDTS